MREAATSCREAAAESSGTEGGQKTRQRRIGLSAPWSRPLKAVGAVERGLGAVESLYALSGGLSRSILAALTLRAEYFVHFGGLTGNSLVGVSEGHWQHYSQPRRLAASYKTG